MQHLAMSRSQSGETDSEALKGRCGRRSIGPPSMHSFTDSPRLRAGAIVEIIHADGSTTIIPGGYMPAW